MNRRRRTEVKRMAQFLLHHPTLVLCVIIITFIPQLSGLESETFKAKKRLVEELTNDSTLTKEIVPVYGSKPVELRIGLSLRQISTVDEVNQAIRLNVWLRLRWNNPFMTWKPQDFANVSSIHLENDLLWKPDLALYNKASLEEEIDILYRRLSTPVVVHFDGNCSWNAPATLLSQCKMDVAQFPFDEQECNVTFGSWTYSLKDINVLPNAKAADLRDFIPNGEWKIVDVPLKQNIKIYDGNVPYPDVTLRLRIRRQPLYYTLNLIVPCTVIAILAFLSFVLPTNHGERVSLVITVLLAMSVYMLIVSSSLPQTSDAIPIIGTYFLCIIVEIALSLFATCFVAKLRDYETEIPKWVDTWINRRLANLVFMPNEISNYDQFVKSSRMNGYSAAVIAVQRDKEQQRAANDAVEKTELLPRKTLDKIFTELSALTEDVNKKHKRQMRLNKWKRAAQVLDRFFLLFFTLSFIIITCVNFA